MHVVIDGLAGWGSGSAVLLRAGVPALVRARREWEWTVVVGPRSHSSLRVGRAWHTHAVVWGDRYSWRYVREITSLPRLAQRIGGDILVCPTDVSPVVGSIPFILMCRNPEVIQPPGPDFSVPMSLGTRMKRKAQGELLKKSASKALAVVTFTHAYKSCVTTALNIDGSKVEVVPPGLDHALGQASAGTTGAERRTDGYVLWAGVNDERKNLRRLLQAWTIVAGDRPELELVMAGVRLEDLPVTPPESVRCLGPLDILEMPTIYSRARLLVNPSLLETFGFPVAEAAAVGIPVACSDTPIFREVCPRAEFFDPLSPDAIAQAITRGLSAVPDKEPVRTWAHFAEDFCALIERRV